MRWFRKALVFSLLTSKHTLSNSWVSIYQIAHSHLACPTMPRFLWPRFLPLELAACLLPPNVCQASLSLLFDQPSPLGSILGLVIPVLVRILLRPFSDDPPPLAPDHPQYLIKFFITYLWCLITLVCLQQESCWIWSSQSPPYPSHLPLIIFCLLTLALPFGNTSPFVLAVFRVRTDISPHCKIPL